MYHQHAGLAAEEPVTPGAPPSPSAAIKQIVLRDEASKTTAWREWDDFVASNPEASVASVEHSTSGSKLSNGSSPGQFMSGEDTSTPGGPSGMVALDQAKKIEKMEVRLESLAVSAAAQEKMLVRLCMHLGLSGSPTPSPSRAPASASLRPGQDLPSSRSMWPFGTTGQGTPNEVDEAKLQA